MTNQYDAYFTHRKVQAANRDDIGLSSYMKNVLPAEKTARILDIGCGLGNTLAAFRNEGYTDISGVDISDEAVACCVSRGLNVAKVREIEDITAGDGAQRFDLIIMSHVLEHIRKDSIIETAVYKNEVAGPRRRSFYPGAERTVEHRMLLGV